MNNHTLRLSMGLLAAVLLSSACVGADTRPGKPAAAGERPGWILNPPSKAGHLYGSGSAEVFAGEAEAMERARDQARLAIVRQFAEVEVSGSLSSSERVSNQDGRESYSSEVENLARSRVKPIKLKYVEFIDHYSERRRVYVLGDLNVRRELSELRQRRDELDAQIAASAQQLADSVARPDIHQIRKLTPALVEMHERAELQSRINALAPSQREPLNSDEQRRFKEQLLEAIASLRVSIASRNGAIDEAMQSGLASRLTERGMRIERGGQGAELRVFYNLDSSERQRDGMYFVSTRGQVAIEDDQGREIAAFSASAKGSSGEVMTARARSLDKLAERMGEQLMAVLLP